MQIKINKKTKIILSAVVSMAIFFCFFVHFSQADITKEISYQGKLTDLSGVAVPDGNYDMTIRIYDQATGGTCLWIARGTCGTPDVRSVAVANGIFSIMLGDTGAGDNAIGLDFNSAYYLGLKIGSDSEMGPVRRKIGASGYAFNSDMLSGLHIGTTGANAHVVVTDSGGNITSSGVLNVTGAGNSTFVGNVGIGTTNPLSLLSVGTSSQFQIGSTGIVTSGIWNGGTIGLAYGGTGIGTTAQSGQLLIGNSSGGYDLSTLTAGTGVTIDNTSGQITINATATGSGSGVVNAGTAGFFSYYLTSGTAVSGQNVLFTDGTSVGIGTTNPLSLFSVGTSSGFQVNASGNVTAGLYNGNTITSGTGTLTLNNNTLTVNGASTINQDVQTSASPTFAGLTVSGISPGSIIYAGAGGLLSQDNANFYYSSGNHRLGIGTTAPSAMVDIFGTNNGLRLSYDSSNYSTLSAAANGSVNIASSNTTDSALTLGTNATTNISLIYDSSTTDYYISRDSSNGNLELGTGQTVGTNVAMAWNSSGYVGIGTTNPTSLFSVGPSSQFQINSSGNILLPDGNAGAPALSFVGDPDTGIYRNGNDILRITVGGDNSAGITIGSAAGGPGVLGIGTTSPGYALDINSNLSLFGNRVLTRWASAGTAVGILTTMVSDPKSPLNFYSSDRPLYLGTDDYNGAIVVSESGNIGIRVGSTAPGSRLTVSGGIAVGTTSTSSDYLKILAPDGGAIFEGNVGIGTTNPLSLFSVGTSSGFQVNASGNVTAGLYNGNTITSGTGTLILNNNTLTVNGASTINQDVQTSASPTFAGLTVSGISPGSIIYAGAGGLLSQDNANFYYSSGNHRLGIGTTAPSAMVDIFGTNNGLRLSYDAANYATLSTSNNGSLSVTTSNTADGGIIFGNNSATNLSIQFDTNATDYYIADNYSGDRIDIGIGSTVGSGVIMTINSTGYVGIGTTNPLYNLDILGTFRLSSTAPVFGSNTIVVPASGTLALGTGVANQVAYWSDANTLTSENYLSLSRGGTGIGTTATSGQLLIGNSSGGYTQTNLTAGSGISISNGSGTITLATTGITSGTGTANYLPKWGTGSTFSNSLLYDSGTYLGLGTTDPAAKLHIISTGEQLRIGYDASIYTSFTVGNDGKLNIQSSSGTQSSIKIGANTATNAGLTFDNLTNDYYMGVDNSDSAKLKIGGGLIFGENPFITITSAGKTGIGTTNPADLLDVAGGVKIGSGYASLAAVAPGDGMIIQGSVGIGTTNPTGIFQIGIGETTPLFVSTGGNVGIGVKDPSNILQIEKNQNTTTKMHIYNLSTGGSASTEISLGNESGSDSLVFYGSNYSDTFRRNSLAINASGVNGNIIFDTYLASAPAMTILSGGNVGIGTTNPLYNLQIAGSLGVSTTVAFTGLLDDAAELTGVLINGNNQLVYREFGSNAFTSTTYLSGSGTANYVSRWIGDSTLGIGALYDNGTNVGIGTTDPLGIFQVGIGATTPIFVSATTGYVGIGTTNPDYILDVTSTAARFQKGLIAYGNPNSITLASYSGGTYGYIRTDNGGVGIRSDENSGGSAYLLGSSGSGLIVITNGNVGIGTTNPLALLNVGSSTPTTAAYGIQFGTDTTANLYRSGAGAIKTDNNFYAGNNVTAGGIMVSSVGTASNPAFGNAVNGGIGMFFAGASYNQLGFSTSSTERLRIADTGNIGIGSTNPNALFTVGATNNFQVDANGNILAGNYQGTTIAVAYGGTGTNTQFNQGSVVFAGGSGIYNQDNANFYYNSTNHFLGLGTTSPGAILDLFGTGTLLRLSYDSDSYSTLSTNNDGALIVSGSNATKSGITIGQGLEEDTFVLFDGNAQDYYLALDDSSDTLNIGIGQTVGMNSFLTINSSGYMGIGTTDPLAALDMGSGGIRLGGVTQTSWPTGSSQWSDITGGIYYTAGNVGIGTSSVGTYNLNIGGTINATTYFVGGSPMGTIAAGSSAGQTLYWNGSSWTANDNIFNNGTNVGIGTTNPLALLSLDVPTESRAQINLAPSISIGPSSPNVGDLWFNGQNLFFQKDGSTSVDILTSVGSQWTNSGMDIYYGSDLSGNVGIGTTTPGAILELAGGMREATGLKISNLDMANYAIDLSNSGLSGATKYDLYMDGSNYWRADGQLSATGSIYGANFYDIIDSSYYLSPSNASISLTTAGNVGIGTNNPDNLLTLSENNGSAILDFRTDSASRFAMGVDYNDSNKFKIEAGATLGGNYPAFTIDGTGNVGIGAKIPDNLLALNMESGNPAIDFETAGVDKFTMGLDHANGDLFKIEAGAAGTLGGGNPAIAINSSGQVGIGNSNPSSLFHMFGGNFTLGSLNAGTAAQIFFQEASGNGPYYVGIKAPDSIASSVTFTLPGTLGSNGQILQTDNFGNLSWSENTASGMANPMSTAGDIIFGTGSGVAARLGIGVSSQCLTVSTDGLPMWGNCNSTNAAGGGASSIQFNSGSGFLGVTDFTWNDTNKSVGITSSVAGAKISIATRNLNAGSTSTNEIQIGNNTSANALSLLVNSSTVLNAGNFAYIYNKNNAPLWFGTNNAVGAVIDAAGRLGVGETSPTAKLSVTDNLVTSGNGVYIQTNNLTTGSLVNIAVGSTSAGAAQTGLKIAMTGANAGSSITTYGIQVSNAHSTAAATTPINVGGLFTADGGAGTTNYSIRTGAMTGATSYGLEIQAMSGTTANYGINMGVFSNGTSGNFGINMGNIGGGGTGAYIMTGTMSATGGRAFQINLGAITGNNATAHYGINMGDISGTTTNAFAINTGSIQGGTASNRGIAIGNIGNAASITGTSYGMSIGTITGGATANYGIYLSAITNTGATNSYGFYTAAQTGTGTGKYPFYTAGITASGVSTNVDLYLGNITGSTGASTNIFVQTGNMSGQATNSYGIQLGTITGGTTSNQGIQLGAISGTATNNYGINIGGVTGGTTSNYGMLVGLVAPVGSASNYGIGVTGPVGVANSSNNYGIKIFSVTASGSSTSNYGLNILAPSGATHNSALEIGAPSTLAGTWSIFSSMASQSYIAGNLGIGTSVPGYLLHTLGGMVGIGPSNPASAAQVRFFEGSTNGTDYVALKAADSIGSPVVFTLPSTDGGPGQILKTNGAGLLDWSENVATGMTNPMTTAGDIIFGTAAGSARRLGIGTTGQCLTVGITGLPVWGNCDGTTAAAGSNSYIQFNSGGGMGAVADFTWDNTNKSVGITGTVAGAKVSLISRNLSNGATATNEIEIGNDAAANTLSLLVNGSNFAGAGNFAYIYNKAAAPLILGTNNAERIRIDPGGNVGIGSSVPLSFLDVTKNAIGASQSDIFGLTLNNRTAAANGAQQYSPPLRFRGYGYTGAASQSADIRMYNRPIQANPLNMALDIQSSVNGAAYNDLMTILSTGVANGVAVGIGTNVPNSKLHIVDNTMTAGNGIYATTTTATSGNLMYLFLNSTAAANNQTVAKFETAGANTTASITTYGIQALNNHGGATSTNIAGYFQATNGVTLNEGIRVAAMTGLINNGMEVVSMSGGTTNIGLNIGAISAGATSDYGIQIGAISGGGTGAALVSGAVSTTGTNGYQLNLGTIIGNNATAHYGITMGAISGVTADAYGVNIGTITGGTTSNRGLNIGVITSTNATTSYGISIAALAGAGATKYGFYLAGLTANNVSTNTGLYIGAVNGSTGASTNNGVQVASIGNATTFATNNYGINIGAIQGGMTANYGISIAGIVSTASAASYGVYEAAITGTGASKYAFYSGGLTSTTNSTNNIGIYIGPISGSTTGTTNTGLQFGNISGTATNNYGINLGTLTGGTGTAGAGGNYQINMGAITSMNYASNYGIFVGGTTGTATSSNNYGLAVSTMNSTGNANYGISVLQPTGATHNAALEIGAVSLTAGTWAVYSSSASPSYFAGKLGLGHTAPGYLLHTFGGMIGIGPSNPTGAAQVRFFEGTSTGTDYVALKSPDAVTAPVVFTLPGALGSANQVLQTDAAGVLSWAPNSSSGMVSPMTTAGDIIFGTGSGVATRLGIGLTSQCLVVSGGLPAWGSCNGATTAGGGNSSIQFNNGGSILGVTDFTWDNTNKSVGITGTTVGAKVSLIARNLSNNAAATNEIEIGNDAAANTLSLLVNSSNFSGGASYAYIYNKQNAPMLLGTNNAERIRINANGNVGIGITSPLALLDVNGVAGFGAGTVAAPSIASRTDLKTGMWFSAANILNFSTNSLERARFDASGNLGVGNTNPLALLDVGGTAWLRGVGVGTSGVFVASTGFVGIGITNPATLLEVTGQASFALGSVGVPGIAFRGNLNTGMWSSVANTINFSTNGEERLRINSAGNLGVGDTNPASRLFVRGMGTSNNFSFRVMDSNNAERFAILDNGNIGIGNSAPAGLFHVGALGTPTLFINTAGNIGLGTTNPGNRLSIVANAAPTADMVNITNLGYPIITAGASALQVSFVGGAAAVEASSIRADITPGSTPSGVWNGIRLVSGSAPTAGVFANAIKIDNLAPGAGVETGLLIGTGWDFGIHSSTIGSSYFAGNVGIGTSAPVSLFQVAATSAPTADMVTISNSGYGVTTTGVSALQVNYVGGAANIEASSIRADITPGSTAGGIWNGIRLVSGSAPTASIFANAIKVEDLTPGAGTEIALDIGTGWDYGVYSQTAGMNYFEGRVGIGTTTPSYALDVIVSGTGPIARFANASDNSSCAFGAGGILTCTSDIRLKKNIADSNYGLNEIMGLRPVDFNWKSQSDNSQKTIGFIAQEVAGVMPQLVITDANGYKELNTIGMVPVIVKGMQEQQNQISNLQFTISNQFSIFNDSIDQLNDSNLSVNDKMNILGNALASESEIMQQIQQDNLTLKTTTETHETRIKTLEEQMALIKETNQAVIDFAKVFNPEAMVYKDASGNIDLGSGKLEADGIVAGAFTVKVVDEERKTIGQEIIKPIEKDENNDGMDDRTGSDGKSIKVSTKAVTETAKIFVSAESDPGGYIWAEKIFDQSAQMFTGFVIKANNSVQNETKVDWWIVEEK